MDFSKILKLFSDIEPKQTTQNVLTEDMKMVTGPDGKKVPDFAADGKGGKDLKKNDSKDDSKEESKEEDKEEVEESINEEEVVDEVAAPGQEDWIKSNKERFIKQYGKDKGMSVLYATAWKRSKDAKSNESLEECWDQAMDGQVRPDQESGMNISSNLNTQTGSKSLTITAQGEAAEQLAQMLKLAGMAGGSAEQHEPEIEVSVEEEYANEPQPEIQPVSTQMQQGNDLNRIKKQDPATANRAANPLTRSLATAESLELKRIEKRLMEELDSIKMSKVKEAVRGLYQGDKGIRQPQTQPERDEVATDIKQARATNRADQTTTGYGNRVAPQGGAASSATPGQIGAKKTDATGQTAFSSRNTDKKYATYNGNVKTTAGTGKGVTEEKMGFKKLEKEIAKNPKVDEPAAVAASIGRKKYGKEKFQKMAAAGKKK